MINIFEFEKALKVIWIKRIHNQIVAQWNILLSNCYGNLNNLFNLGDEWCNTIMHKTQNTFWQNVFKYWILLCRSQTVESNSEIMLSNIWYNFHISHQPLYLPKWHKKVYI